MACTPPSRILHTRWISKLFKCCCTSVIGLFAAPARHMTGPIVSDSVLTAADCFRFSMPFAGHFRSMQSPPCAQLVGLPFWLCFKAPPRHCKTLPPPQTCKQQLELSGKQNLSLILLQMIEEMSMAVAMSVAFALPVYYFCELQGSFFVVWLVWLISLADGIGAFLNDKMTAAMLIPALVESHGRHLCGSCRPNLPWTLVCKYEKNLGSFGHKDCL